MKEKLTSSSASQPIGEPCGRNLFKVDSGAYVGRLAAIVAVSATELKLYRADGPYSDWSAVQSIDSNCDNESFDVFMDDQFNLHLAYCEGTNGYVKYRKLSFSGGVWSIGSAVTVYDGASAESPTIAVEPSGKLWIAFTIYSAPNRDLYTKASTDDGATWGSGASDIGTQLQSGYANCFPRLLRGNSDIYAVFTSNYSYVTFRSVPFLSSSWSAAEVIGSGSSIDHNFDAAIGPDGILGVVWDDASLKYREFDGANWGAVIILDATACFTPQLVFRNNHPMVVYLVAWFGELLLKYTHRQSGSFSTPADFSASSKLVDCVQLYDASSSSYSDLTSAAQSGTTSDIFHPDSSCMVKDIGDAILVGMNSRFRFIMNRLSTVGAGGSLSYSYWDGTGWKGFTPVGGDVDLDAASSDVLLFADLSEAPNDWQMTSIEGNSFFWIRMEVDGAYSTGPVGNIIHTIGSIGNMSFVR